jgi:outer membrane protein assembly factor BamB
MWRDNKPVVCSDALFAQNRHTGKTLWIYSPQQGVIINPTIAVGGGRVYWVESTNPETREVANGRINLKMLLGKGSAMVALDMSSGEILWRKPVDFHEI